MRIEWAFLGWDVTRPWAGTQRPIVDSGDNGGTVCPIRPGPCDPARSLAAAQEPRPIGLALILLCEEPCF